LQGLFPWLRTVARTPCFLVTALRAQEPGADRSVTDPELCGDLSQAVALRLQLQNLFRAHGTLRAAQRLAIRLRIPNPGSYPFPYAML
jgi:hypothetical protein